MNTKYISEDYDLSVFTDKFGRIVDWHYGTDYPEEDDGFWHEKWKPDGGNAGVFESAVRYVQEHGVDDPKDLPGIYLTPTEQKTTGAEGPTLLLLEWPIMEKDGMRNPSHIFSVHTTDENGWIVPPLPEVLGRRLAKAVIKNNK